MNKSVTYAVVKVLAAHLMESVQALKSVVDDFPAPSQKLQYPCASIFTRAPDFTSGPYYVVKKTVGEDGKTTVRRAVGNYEFKLQVDVWCDNKFSRHQLQEDVFKALNPYPGNGLSKQLNDYFGEFAHYTMTGFDFPDSGDASQRGEWRVRFSVIVDVKAIIEGLDVTISEIENNLETPGTISSPPMEQSVETVL